MQRKCDGTDPNLIRYDHAEGEQCPDWPICKHAHPCDCGLEFDDVDHMVIYPHRTLPTEIEKKRMRDLVDKYLDESLAAN